MNKLLIITQAGEILVVKFADGAFCSEGADGAGLQMFLQLGLKSLAVGTIVWELEQERGACSLERSALVLQDVEGEAGQAEVGDAHLFANHKLRVVDVLLKLRLDHLEELAKNAFFDFFYRLLSLIGRCSCI